MHPYVFSILLLVALVTELYAQKPVKILQHPHHVRIQRLYLLNSPFRETNPNITPDGKYLYFMSTRGGQRWSMPRSRPGGYEFDGDIFYSKKVNGQWTPPVCLPPPVNTWNGEDEPNVSPDGRIVYFQSWEQWESRGGPYFQAQIINGRWENLRGLGGGITQYFLDLAAQNPFATLATDGMTISPDGSLLILATGDYYGNMDLYYSRRDPKSGQWSYLRRLPISTPGNDRHPFLAGDGKTLFFASDGYKGFGGLDIFKVVMHDEYTFGEVVNIGAPFNTPADDECFILTADGSEAYFTRNGDLYYANIEEADPELKPLPTVLLAGKVVDANNGRPLGAKVSVSTGKKILTVVQSDPKTGEFSLVLQDLSGQYTVSASHTTYQPYSTTLKPGPIQRSVHLYVTLPLTSHAELARQQQEEQQRQQEEAKRQERLQLLERYGNAQAAVTQKILQLESLSSTPN